MSVKIRLNVPIDDIAGNPIKDDEGLITAKSLILRAVLNPLIDAEGRALRDVKKVEKFELAMRIQESTSNVDLSINEASILKECIDQTFPSPLIVGRLNQILGEIQ